MKQLEVDAVMISARFGNHFYFMLGKLVYRQFTAKNLKIFAKQIKIKP